jgi:hypothetical protein
MTVTALDRALVVGGAGRVTGEQERPDPGVTGNEFIPSG